MTYKAVLFDLDDTLLCSRVQKWKQHQAVALREYGVTITDEAIKSVWGMPFLEMIERLYQGADEPERIAAVIMACDGEFPKTAYNGSAQSTSQLMDAGIAVGVISSAPTDLMHHDLRRLGFDLDRMAFALGHDQVKAHKPDPRVFDDPLAILGISPSEAAYVGDLPVDFYAASAAGLDFVAVTSGVTTEAEFRSLGAGKIVPGVVEAVELILQL
jgi:phosphoglycolate phosphatase-like HAD superfamily hydrolase